MAATPSGNAGALRIGREGSSDSSNGEPVDRRTLAARQWAAEIDATIGRRLASGREVQIRVPTGDPWLGRISAETLEDYRRLRLGVGELIRPWLLDREGLAPPPLASLYAFQRTGVLWLLARQGGSVLADDMGLGKTIQVIAAVRLLFNRAEAKHVLIVCPKSLIANWEAEFQSWAPELGVAVLSPPARLREAAWRVVAQRRHVLLTNYEQMREPPQTLQTDPPDLVVADEAHRLRKRSAKVTAGILSLTPKRFWALSGTPLERDTNDLATLLSIVEPKRFSARDARLHPASLRAQARPYVLRRQKSDVLSDLPPVRDTTERIDLTPDQEREYQRAIAAFRRRGGDGNELALLTRLRGICDVEPTTGASSKADRITELLVRIRDQGEKAVVFAYLLEPLKNIEKRIVAAIGADVSRLLVGEMDMEERTRVVREFREDEHVLVLLASTRVGGEGLTLVEANHVFLLDQWWNPSSNDQATDRVVRIGQKNPVRIYRFCCRGTIEERLEKILREKRDLFDKAVGQLAEGSEQALDRIRRAIGIERLLSDAKPTLPKPEGR